MSWSGSTRRSRLPADWSARVSAVRARAGGRCEAREHVAACDGRGTDCDHIVAGDDHDLSNLQWLSRPCHQAKTARDRQAWKRRPEQHPGLA